MSKRIIVDPITRIEGHLRIECEADNGKIVNSWSSGQMWRCIETILQGRDPRDAWIFTQRICVVCTTVHAITSVRAVENALDLEVPLKRPVYQKSYHQRSWHFLDVASIFPNLTILSCFTVGD